MADLKRILISVLCLAFMIYADLGTNLALSDELGAGEEGKKMQTIELKSASFGSGEMIPRKYTCDGEDVSPALSWGSIPEGTKEIVLICDDPDAPGGTWVHWVLFGLAPDSTSLTENFGKKETVLGVRQGKNDFGKVGYGGPCPPKGPAHRYFFKLYALDKSLDLKPEVKKADVMKAIDGHILGHGEIVGRYGR
jgi:Raf kinase inhibitor-like YbhB/YbcL family protein